MANKVYDYVTERVLDLLDKGTVPWQKPWKSEGLIPMNYRSKKPYRGINLFLLAFSGHNCPYFLTYKQATEMGGTVRKGEKSQMVVFYKTLDFEKEKDGQKSISHVPFLRYYNVFNLEQIDGIEIPKPVDAPIFNSIEEAEKIVRLMPNKPSFIGGGNSAFYRPFTDAVGMPPKENFISPEEYYSTLFHELAHSTGHESRLNRFDKNAGASMFGSESYSNEELIAEMTACMLCGVAGIENSTINNSVAYINSWRTRISSDPKLVVSAAAKAQKAADLILNVKFDADKEETTETK